MLSIQTLTLVALVSAPNEAPWTLDGKKDGVFLYRRDREGSELREFKVTGMVDAPLDKVWELITDYVGSAKRGVYTKHAEIRKVEDNGAKHVYVLTDPPMIDPRDYCLRYYDATDPKATDGSRTLKFNLSNEGPPLEKGVVRIPVFEGYWHLEPRENGKKTFATYYVYTDPGGSIPKWIINRLGGASMNDMMFGLRQRAQESLAKK